LTVRAERLVYLGEWSTRGIVVRLEFAERRFEFTVEREYNVDLISACHDVNSGPRPEGRDGPCLVNEGSRGTQFDELAGR
jgi:hypothetical protein